MSQTWVNIYLPLWIQRRMTIEQLQAARDRVPPRITQPEYNMIIATPQNPE
jgi:hypothetical protein